MCVCVCVHDRALNSEKWRTAFDVHLHNLCWWVGMPHLDPTISHKYTWTPTHNSLSHTFALFLSHSLTHSLTHSHTHTLSLSHTDRQTHTLTHWPSGEFPFISVSSSAWCWLSCRWKTNVQDWIHCSLRAKVIWLPCYCTNLFFKLIFLFFPDHSIINSIHLPVLLLLFASSNELESQFLSDPVLEVC